jgi:hypothetical protein
MRSKKYVTGEPQAYKAPGASSHAGQRSSHQLWALLFLPLVAAMRLFPLRGRAAALQGGDTSPASACISRSSLLPRGHHFDTRPEGRARTGPRHCGVAAPLQAGRFTRAGPRLHTLNESLHLPLHLTAMSYWAPATLCKWRGLAPPPSSLWHGIRWHAAQLLSCVRRIRQSFRLNDCATHSCVQYTIGDFDHDASIDRPYTARKRAPDQRKTCGPQQPHSTRDLHSCLHRGLSRQFAAYPPLQMRRTQEPRRQPPAAAAAAAAAPHPPKTRCYSGTAA